MALAGPQRWLNGGLPPIFLPRVSSPQQPPFLLIVSAQSASSASRSPFLRLAQPCVVWPGACPSLSSSVFCKEWEEPAPFHWLSLCSIANFPRSSGALPVVSSPLQPCSLLPLARRSVVTS